MKNKNAYLWSLIGRTVPQFILLLATMILSRKLSPVEFGTIGVLSILYVVAGTILDSGLGGSLIKEQNLTKDDCSTIFTFNLFVSIFLYIILFVSASHVECFYNVVGISSVVRILSLILIVNAIGLVPLSLMVKNLNFRERAISNISASIISSIFAIIIAYCNGGVYALVTLQLGQSVVNSTMYHFYSRFPFTLKFNPISFKKLYKFGIFTTLSNVVDSIYENIITTFCGKYLSIQQAGYFSQAKRVEDIGTLSISQTVNSVSFPVLSKLTNNIDEFKNEASQILKYVVLLSFPPMLIIALYSRLVIITVFGNKWEQAGPYLEMFIFAAMFILLENTNRNFIKSLGAVSKLFIYTILKRIIGISVLIASLVINPEFILYAFIISSFIGFIVNMILYCSLADLQPLNYLLSNIYLVFTPILFYIVNFLFIRFVEILPIQLLFTLITIGIYYIHFMPYFDIDILKIIKAKFFKSQV